MPLITDSIGRVLGGRYRLVSALGSGASAHVYLAQDVSLQRNVAVKVLQPTLVRDEAFLKRFRAEARSVASLNHPHVLRVFDWGEDADGPYLVLEYLGGGSLRDLLDRNVHLTPAQAVHVGAQAAQGLAYAHGRGLVHRDVKPANLLFDDEGRVRIADFGVARALAEAAWTEPVGAMIGTARYASPEQAEGRPVDGRADVYSLSLVLYEAVTGVVPFVTDTTMGTLMARVGAPLPRHPALGPLDDVLARAAAPDAGARLQASQLASRLEALAASLPPADPLPLAPEPVEERPRNAFRAPGVGELTEVAPHDPGPASGAVMVATAGQRKAGPDEIFDAEALQVWATGPTPAHASGKVAAVGAAVAPTPAPPAPTTRRRRRKRWPWIVGIAAVVVALVVAGLLVAWRQKVFTASHPVPTLTGKTLAEARSALAADHFTLQPRPSVFSVKVPPGRVISQTPGPSTSLKEGSTVTVVPSKGLPSEQIPSLASLTCSAAQQLLASHHLAGQCPPEAAAYSTTVPAGQVINWSYNNLLNATSAPYGSTVLMAVSKGLPPATVGDYSGQSFDDAASGLHSLGLQATQTQQASTTVPAGQVIGTSPAAGQQAPAGSTVTVIVSSGPPSAQVPNVEGKKVAPAEALLKAAGFPVGHVFGPASGTIFTQTPAPGTSQPVGTAINLYTM